MIHNIDELKGRFNCPYCQTTFHIDYSTCCGYPMSFDERYRPKKAKTNNPRLYMMFFQCPECDEITILGFLDSEKAIHIKPNSVSKKYPDYIPQQIRNDYKEACDIMYLSPKASATLARRCLQGIIRDFYKITNKRTLADEIDALRENNMVTPDLISAFHTLRETGNIGAHMEKDVNLIIDISLNEAQYLINFLEFLIETTYIEKHNTDNMFNKLNSIRESIDKQKNKTTQLAALGSSAQTVETPNPDLVNESIENLKNT